MSDEQLDTEATEQGEATDEPSGDELAASEEDASGAGKRTLGTERWVQLGFMAVALLLVWFLTNVISAAWYFFADPNESIVTAVGVVLGLGFAVALYRRPAVHALATEVADELSKVTWPTRNETSSSTIIVIVTSIIAAAMLGVFDAVWSAVTDLVYKV